MEETQIKVVLFCGGLGLRLYPDTDIIPKPLIHVGNKPIVLHLMEYYSSFGHNHFILCLGYKGNEIKKYFQKNKDNVAAWIVKLVDTGLHSNIGQRLKKVEKYLDKDNIFFANYSDVLTDLYLPQLTNYFIQSNKTGCFLSVRPYQSFHVVSANKDGLVDTIHHVRRSNLRINGGFFIFKKDIFSYINEGEELVNEPFQRLIEKQELIAYEHNGFWACMDTFKDKQQLDEMFKIGDMPWKITAR